jgi:hypothetical protein
MKFSVILSIVCIGIGIAIGWIAKPAPESEVVQIEPPKESSRKEGKPTNGVAEKSERRATPSARVIGGESRENMSDEQREQMKKYQNRFGEMMKKRRMAKLDARISKLVAQLNLTPDQEAALRKAAEEDGGDVSGGFDPSKLTGSAQEGDLETALAEVLTEEQKEEHEALKKRELANKVEARALKEMAKLSNLDMTQEQKDAAYDILYKQAEDSSGNDSTASGIASIIGEGIGIELNSNDLGIDFAAGGETGEEAKDGKSPNPQDFMARMKENRQKNIDQKVEALRPVLDDTQLEQYRKDLEFKSQGILGGMSFGLETE